MASKTLVTILLIFVALFCIPIFIGIAGGIIGLIAGIFGAIAGVFIGIVSAFASIFTGHWHFWHFNSNVFTAAVLVLILLVVLRTKKKNKTP